jgi:thiamine-phosphate pyrophosphorylase
LSGRIDPERLRVYAIVDPRASSLSVVDLADAIYGAGVGVIQLRAKGAADDELRCWSADFVERAFQHDTLFIVNDRLELAIEVGADGVHLGPSDETVAEARKTAPDLIVGGSAGTVERAVQLEGEGADYLGCGAVWDAHDSKPDASAPRGLEMIRDVSAAVGIPVVGIGGVTAARAPAVIEAGASGVAVIRAILGNADPGAAAARLVSALTR